MCSFGVSFLVSACVCDLCRVRLWRLPSLLSSQAHNVTLAFIVPLHTHLPTHFRIHKTYLDIHTFTPLSLWWLQLVGSVITLFLSPGQGLPDLCVRQCVYLYPHALYYASVGVWATLVVIVWFLVCICVGRCDFCAFQLWVGGWVRGYQWFPTALTPDSENQSCHPCKAPLCQACLVQI